MPMMARMRGLAPWFITTVGVLFVILMAMPSNSSIAELFGARSNNVGSVDGKDISYQEFSSDVEKYKERQKQQSGQDIDEDNLEQFRDQVWDAIVTQNLTEQQIKKYGIDVLDKEIYESIMGPNPPEMLKSQFTDSLGHFNRDLYDKALHDKKNAKVVKQVEDAMRQQLLSEKLQSYVSAGLMVSEGEIHRRYIDQNIKMNAEFVAVDISNFSDANTPVSNDEMKKYYDEHPDKFTVQAQRKIKFVLLPIQATAADTAQVLANLQDIATRAKDDTASFKSYVDIYSDTPYGKDTLDVSALGGDFPSAAAGASVGALIGPMRTQTGYALYKYYGSAEGKETYVRASHILVPDEAEANRIYEEIKQSGNFAAAAAKYSKDPGSAVNGGDLGWFAKGRMVKEFEDACFGGAVNVVQKPVKSSFGYHIIKVTGKSSQRFVVEKITNALKPSATTKDIIYHQASDFAYLADKNDFDKEAELEKLAVRESSAFTEDAYTVPGVGYSRIVVKFAFDNSINTVSKAFKTANGYVVAKVSEIIKPGVRKFDDVQKEVKALVIKDKKLEKAMNMAEMIKKNVGSDLAKAQQLYSQAKYGTAADFTTSGSIPSVGLEYNFAAAASKASYNQVIGPVKGSHAYYLIKVTGKTQFDQSAYAVQHDGLRDNMLNEKRQMLFSQWLSNLREHAKIVDRRYQFYER